MRTQLRRSALPINCGSTGTPSVPQRWTPPRQPPRSPVMKVRWANGGRLSTGPSSPCTPPCSRMGKYSPTTRWGTTRPKPVPIRSRPHPSHNWTRHGTQTPANVNTGFNIFCSGLAHLMDGSLFVAGGNKDALLSGIVEDPHLRPDHERLELGPNMAASRWYPSVTPLNNGEMLITEGGPDMPEVLKTDGTLRTLARLRSICRSIPGWTLGPTAVPSTPDPTRRCAASTPPVGARGRP